MSRNIRPILLAAIIASSAWSNVAQAQRAPPQFPDMTFFITSAGPGSGADLGGLAGADQHCQDLAYAVGFGDVTWRAYLSTVSMGGESAVNARDRIGDGPWHNYSGDLIAASVGDLHSDDANLTKETILGDRMRSRGEEAQQTEAVIACNILNRVDLVLVGGGR